VEELRKLCPDEMFDYGMLMYVLRNYRAPHRKITTLLKSEQIIRVKKGLYIFGERYRAEPIQREILANLIYGPSYVSQEYALSYYGLIPERVEMVTSMTPKRNKLFHTPVGTFSYDYLRVDHYTIGVNWEPLDDKRHYLIACPEKALIDSVARYRNIKTIKDMTEHLLENLRIEIESLEELDEAQLQKIINVYNIPTTRLLLKTIKRIV